MIDIKTTYSGHVRCFICRRKKKLHTINRKSILDAYKNYKIIIKNNSRSCSDHLDENGLIKEDHFDLIPTIFQPFQNQVISILDSLVIDCKSGIFDQFRDVHFISEELCFKITGWTKTEFIKFSKYISCVYDTSGRTKEQMIAIYRFWLRKGIDQTSLAMFKNNCSQQHISYYLDRIRQAMTKDFVPNFLGSKKPREFYLSHNNITTTILHQMEKNDLSVVVDATYTRLEKSANNEFQYNCWSQQKMGLLIKPFVICCTDGYIIDCYGPFQANLNDAKIFEYILETDKELLNILTPKNTVVFLDRGFRDIVDKLRNDYNFITKIPTCEQLSGRKKKTLQSESDEDYDNEMISKRKTKQKKKQLSTNETTETRMVTKVCYLFRDLVLFQIYI